jgi:hypothetical protein
LPNITQFFSHIVCNLNHGGLTPAALVNLRLCTANVVISAADVVWEANVRTLQQERLA